MSLRINHNIASLVGHNAMLNNDAAVSNALQQLSTGLRINSAADDPAGLVISEQMRAQISGLTQAVSNSETAVSMVQTAEGALDEDNTLLNKARSLALHAANDGVNDQNQLVADQSELDNIIDSVDRIAANTQFGTKRLLDGSLSQARSNNAAIGSVKFGSDYAADLASATLTKGYYSLQVTQTATHATQVISISGQGVSGMITGSSLAGMLGTDKFKKTFSFSVMGQTVSVVSGQTKQNLFNQLNALGKSLGFVASTTGTLSGLSGNITLTASAYGSGVKFDLGFVAGFTGATGISGTFTSGQDWAATLYLNSGLEGAVTNSNATKTETLTGKGMFLQNSGGYRIQLLSPALIATGTSSGWIYAAIDGTTAGATFQIGANVGQKATVELDAMNASNLGQGASSVFGSLAELKGSSLISGKSDDALKVIDKAINDITVTRGNLGAFQANTLDSGLNSLRTTQENLTAAESTIRDVDFAAESAEFTKDNILVQASTAMLAQANQLPQNVLKLLA